MAITLHKLPEVLETYFLDEAKTIPLSHWGKAVSGQGFLGPDIRRLAGFGTMAGWALTVEISGDNNLPALLALQFMLDRAKQGRWVMVISQEAGTGPSRAALWNYLQSAMGWEVGFVGAVVQGYAADIDEVKIKLQKEFSVFAHGPSPVPALHESEGTIGEPVTINGVRIRTGDLIVGDDDGVMCVPRDMVVKAAESCRLSIIDEVNRLQEVREGKGAVDVLDLGEILKDNVEIVE